MPLLETMGSGSARSFGLTSFLESASDLFFKYVRFLSGTSTTNNLNNNTFIDSSANNFTVVKNGDIDQGSFNPYLDRWSAYFDGNNSCIRGVDTAAVNFGTGDFTFEFWAMPYKSVGVYGSVGLGTAVGVFLFNFVSSGAGAFPNQVAINKYGTGPHWTFNYSFTQKWYHIAYVRSSGVGRLYIDGSLVNSATDTVSYDAGSWGIGSGGGATQPFKGKVADLRVTKSAVYTSNFTPPTQKLSAIANTTILTCRSSRFLEEVSGTTFYSFDGTPKIISGSPYNPLQSYNPSVHSGSFRFNGSEDYITISDNPNLELGSGNFTIEMWAYPFDGNNAEVYNKEYGFQLYLASNAWRWYGATANTGAYNILDAFNGGTAVPFTWQHIALVRNGNTFTSYLNGQVVATTTSSNTFHDHTAALFIGRYATGGFHYNGFLSDIRLTKAVVYNGAFTPPTQILSSIANTQLLLNGANAGIYNRAGSQNQPVLIGDTKTSTAQAKYGSTSMFFDGTGDYLALPNNDNYYGDWHNPDQFTMEYWIYPSASIVSGSNNNSCVLGHGDPSTGSEYWTFGPIADRTVRFYWWSGGPNSITTTSTISLNAWSHLAFVKNGTSLKIFINGIESASATLSTTPQSDPTFRVNLGTNNGSSFTGYIDDFRITNGAARYTTNFSVPLSELGGR